MLVQQLLQASGAPVLAPLAYAVTQVAGFSKAAAGRSPKVPKAARVPKPPSIKEKPAVEPPKKLRAVSAYTLFVKQNASKYHGRTGPDLIRQCAIDWKKLSDADKAPFQRLAEASRSEVAAKRAEIKKNKPPSSAFTTYVGEAIRQLRADHPGLSATEYMKQAAERWQQLPDAEKKRRKVAYEQAKAAWQAQSQQSS